MLDVIVFPGISIAFIVVGAYFAIRRRQRMTYLILNVLFVGLFGIWVFAQGVDIAAPSPHMFQILFMFFYVPLHLGLVAIVCAISWFWERHKKRKAESIEAAD